MLLTRAPSRPEAVEAWDRRIQELLDRVRVLFQVVRREGKQRQLVQQIAPRPPTGQLDPVCEQAAEPPVTLGPRVAQDKAIDVIGISQDPFLAYRASIEEPTALTRSSASADTNSCTSSAICLTEYGPGVIGLPPIPRLSNVTRRCELARSATGSSHEL